MRNLASPVAALMVLVLVCAGGSSALAAAAITTEAAYTARPGAIPGPSSLAVDGAGTPHMAFVDDALTDPDAVAASSFVYGTKTGGLWTFEIIGANGFDPIYGDPNPFMSLALDPSGNPHVAFWDPVPNLLRYASKSAGLWTIETADPVPNNGRVAMLAIDGMGNPHITYYDQDNVYMKYATKSGGLWANEIIDNSGVLQPFPRSLSLDPMGNPHVVYWDYYAGVIKYATRSGGVWASEVVPGTGTFPAASYARGIAADAAGNPHIALIKPDGVGALLHLTKSGGVWTTEPVEPGTKVQSFSINTSPAGVPCISFYDITGGINNLKYATRAGGAWSSIVVDAPGSVGAQSCLAFDASGAHITYRLGTNVIKYASIEASGGDVSGSLLASCPAAGTPLLGVTVDALTLGGGMLAGSTVTDASGSYGFQGLAAGNYTISIVTPLGYAAASAEQTATVLNGQTTAVNFALSCDTPSGDVRADEYWKHEFAVAMKGNGHADADATTLCGYLDQIETHFNSNQVNPVVVYAPPASGLCDDKLAAAAVLLNLQGSAAVRDKARECLLALLLNVASGRLGTMSVVSNDGATASQAITYCDNQIDSPTGNWAKAKSIADDINKGKKVAAGMIPLATAQIAYRQGLAMRTFTVTPNSGQGARKFSFTMGQAGSARLHVYDVSGRMVANLAEGPIAAGSHTITWDGRTSAGNRVGTGIYFASLESTDGSKTLKVIQQTP